MNKRELGSRPWSWFSAGVFSDFTDSKVQNAIMEAFYMLQWYVRYHTLACVVPAMFIAGACYLLFEGSRAASPRAQSQ